MGPFIATGLDPMKLAISVKGNGETVSEYSTEKMLFSVQHYISQISRYMTLWPGDVVLTDTDNATIPNLKHSDTCEIIQSDIGVLRNGTRSYGRRIESAQTSGGVSYLARRRASLSGGVEVGRM